MPRPSEEPTREVIADGHREGEVRETHPGFGRVVLTHRTSNPGASLFDSEILHSQYVVLSIHHADRTRSLNRDWIHPTGQVVEIAMSEAQWAAMVSSAGRGEGTSCTIESTETMRQVPSIPFDPRLALSTAETREAADRMMEKVKAAFALVQEKPTKANLRTLAAAIENSGPNVEFAAKSLTNHVENVVQKARADVEAMVDERARAVGLPTHEVPSIGFAEPEAIEAESPLGEVLPD